jgi:hypothetical protein
MESVTVQVAGVAVGVFHGFVTFCVGLCAELNVPADVDHEYEAKFPVPPLAEHPNWTVAP